METYEQKHEDDEKELYKLLNQLDAINSDNSQNYND